MFVFTNVVWSFRAIATPTKTGYDISSLRFQVTLVESGMDCVIDWPLDFKKMLYITPFTFVLELYQYILQVVMFRSQDL